MGNKYNIGPKIGIDGEREFRKQLSQLNNAYKTLTAETKAVTAAFDANGDEQGKLKKTGEQLQKQIDLQQKKVSLLSDMVQKATAKFGENSDEVTRLKGVMYDAQASLSGLEGELKDVNQKLKEDTKAVEDFGEEADETQEKIVDFGDILAANFLSDALYDGLQELSGKLKDIASDSIQAAADVAAETAQFEQTFGELKDTANDALKGISETTHISVTRLQGSYTKLYAFAKTVGAEQEQALDISSRALIAAADSAAYYDRSVDEALESLQAFLKGNYANDAALGIAATETTRNTMANKLYAKSFNELSESQKVETLLAMVEAGNAASGAMGQAAREADNWTNVTGELSEAFRQLLAKAGAPVLKKITPIVQDITESLYDISEDINWDKFGDTVSAIIDFALKNLPKIAKGLVSVGAGFAAMKLTTTIVSVIETVSAFKQLTETVDTASDAIKVASAAMNTTPWGLAASAIGLVAGALTAVILNTRQTQSELDKAMESFESSMEQAEQTYRATVTEVNAAAYAAQHYIDRLKELENAGLDTNEAQQEYAMCVEQLNGLIPDLNLSINEQTGLLEQNTDAITADIEAWKNRAIEQALYDQYTEELEAQAKATATLMSQKAELLRLQEKERAITNKLVEIRSAYNRKSERMAEIDEALANAHHLSAEEVNALSSEYRNLVQASEGVDEVLGQYELDLMRIRDSQKGLNADIAESQATINKYTPIIELASTAIDMFRQGTESATAAQGNQNSSTDELVASVQALTTAYDEAYAEAEESLNSQIGLWEELNEESKYTAESIVENWSKQKKAFENYDKNLRAAVNKKLDMRLIQDLSDGSLESMLILDALVNDADISVEEINTAFSENMDVRGALAETMAAVKLLEMPEAQQLIADSGEMITDSVDLMVNIGQNGGILTGKAIVQGAIYGIKQNERSLEIAAAVAGRKAIGGLNKGADVHSPSKASEATLKYVIDGGIVGLEKNAARLERKMRQVGDDSASALLTEKLLSVSEHIGSIAMPNTYSNTSIDRRNYGGFHFTINQLPGESADDLADRVMEKIQTAVDQKGAVFHV